MRSGLQSPGAVPLLAVLVAALLSITPNLCEAWTDAGSSPGIGYQAESSIYPVESASTISPPDLSAPSIIISTFTNIDLLWQQACQVTASILSSYKSSLCQDPESVDCDLDESSNILSQQIRGSVHNSTEPHPITRDSTSITISFADLPRLTNNQKSPQFSSAQHPPANQLEKSAHVNSSSPVDSKGSYMAILISLVVAIMWF